MSWSVFEPSFDVAARKYGMPVPRAMEELHRTIQNGVMDGTIAPNEALALEVEKVWHAIGRPSYRVAAPLADALVETNLALDASLVRFPHAAFALELPAAFVLRDLAGNRLKGLLVAATRDVPVALREMRVAPGSEPPIAFGKAFKVEAPDGEGTWRFAILQSWEGPDESPVIFTVGLDEGEEIGAKLRRVVSVDPTDAHAHEKRARGEWKHDPTITADEQLQKIVALALGAAFFAVGANAKLVRPLGNPKAKREGRRADRRPPEPRRWSLGADIKLPKMGVYQRPPRDLSTDGVLYEDSGRSLRWAHIRQGHLRLVPCGPKDDRRYELRYIAPTVVRPDLPLAPGATKHAMDMPKGS